MIRVYVIAALTIAAAACGNDSPFAEPNVPQTVQLLGAPGKGTDWQVYSATMIVPASARPHVTDPNSVVELDHPLMNISINRVAILDTGPKALTECDDGPSQPVRDVRRELLADGEIVSCRRDGTPEKNGKSYGLEVIRMIRVDQMQVFCEVTRDKSPATDLDVEVATNMCKSLTLAWRADSHPKRFRFPCHGELSFGRDAVGAGSWATVLECPPESKGVD